MNKIKLFAAATVSLFFLAGNGFAQDTTPIDEFWASLQKICGKAYSGTVAAAPADDTTFKGKTLVMDAYSCQERKIKINVLVGEDRSRTWVFYQADNRILLKHEHRLKNGDPDPISNYGGWTTNPGSATTQIFPADFETARVVPAAVTNVWWTSIEPGKSFSYNLQRLGTERFFSLKFDLTKPVPVPKLIGP